MGRAGWTLWLAYDLGGSYEEVPSTLLEEMKRDRRWCQGNLQHLRLLFTEGLFGAHRALFLNGVLVLRLGAALVRASSLLSTAEAIQRRAARARLLPARAEPVSRSGRSGGPTGRSRCSRVTGVILFLPKVLERRCWSSLHAAQRAPYGGVVAAHC